LRRPTSDPALLASIAIRVAGLDEILALRHRELRPGLPLEAARFDGDDEESTRHFGAFLAGGSVVACASFMARPWQHERAWQLRGMATRADLARRGLGTALLDFAESSIRAELGAHLLWCNARVGAVPFYARVGWSVVSEPFDIAGVGPHRAMLRRLD
jgi:predicted GNAT family N-acyltransferase